MLLLNLISGIVLLIAGTFWYKQNGLNALIAMTFIIVAAFNLAVSADIVKEIF